MALISLQLDRAGWTGSGTIEGGNTYTIVHRAISNNKNDGPLTIANQAENAANGIPRAFDPYAVGNDVDTTVVMKSRSTELVARASDDGQPRIIWAITSTYSKPGKNEEGDTQRNPVSRPTKYRLDFATYSKLAAADKDGNPVVNSAGRRFAEQFEIDDTRPVLTATRNVQTLQQVVDLATRYKSAVNSDPFWGVEKRHALCEAITTGDREEENGFSFFPVTFKIQFNSEPWDHTAVDQGFAYYDSTDEATRKLIDVDGADPVLLNPDGTKKDAGETGDILTFKIYREEKFAGMGI